MLTQALPAASIFLADSDEKELAVEIYELARTFPHVAYAQLFEDVVGCEIGKIAECLSPEVAKAAHQRGRERDPWETVKELLTELESDEVQA